MPIFGKILVKTIPKNYSSEEKRMYKKNYKGKCIKRKLSKCKDFCRTFSEIADVYAQKLEESEEILEIRCNVFLDGFEMGEYTSDFVCKRTNGELMVRECVKKHYEIQKKVFSKLHTEKFIELVKELIDRVSELCDMQHTLDELNDEFSEEC